MREYPFNLRAIEFLAAAKKRPLVEKNAAFAYNFYSKGEVATLLMDIQNFSLSLFLQPSHFAYVRGEKGVSSRLL